MIVAYGLLFRHAQDKARGLPGCHAPEGRLLATHLLLRGTSNIEGAALRFQHAASPGRPCSWQARGLARRARWRDRLAGRPVGPAEGRGGLPVPARASSGGRRPALRRTVRGPGYSAAAHCAGGRSGVRTSRHVRSCRPPPCPVTSETGIGVLLSGAPAIGCGLPPRAM